MKLSIIVPVYNLENYIATTLESLLSIRFSSNYEIVVINDGSKDGNESVISKIQSNCAVFHRVSSSLGQSRRPLAIRHCKLQ